MTVSAAGDSRKLTGQKFRCAADIDAARRRAGITQRQMVDAAGMSESSYRRLVAGRSRLSPAKLARLVRALSLVGRGAKLSAPEAQIILSTWRGFVGELVGPLGAGQRLTVDDVAASDPQRGATADPRWRACRRIAQAGIYLVSISFDVSQRRLAELFDLTPAAICLACKAVEDMRDDPAFEAALEAAQHKMTGRAAA